MALKKTKLIDVIAVSGVSTVGIYTAGLTATTVGVGTTSYVRSVVMHNTGLATCRVGLYVYPNTTSVQRVATGFGVTAYRVLRVDMASNETTFFESNYPIVLTPYNAIAVDVTAPDSGGAGIGSAVNFIINGDTDG